MSFRVDKRLSGFRDPFNRTASRHAVTAHTARRVGLSARRLPPTLGASATVAGVPAAGLLVAGLLVAAAPVPMRQER